MKILAIHIGHNSTVGILDAGRIVALLSQEKLDNIKNSAAFPAQVIHALMKERELTLKEIDEVVIGSSIVYPPERYDYLFRDPIGSASKHSKLVSAVRSAESGVRAFLPGILLPLRRVRQTMLEKTGRMFVHRMLEQTGLGDKPVTYVDHHLCHARAAYHSLAQDEAPSLVLTLDGGGDGLCATVSVASGNHMDRIAETPVWSSLGHVYSETTRFLGMKALEHEYKVMGLAPYCKGYEERLYRRVFAPVIDLDPRSPLTFKANLDTRKFYDHLLENAIGERFDNVAGAVQRLLEEQVTKWIRACIRHTEIRRIYTGGGVFMNVKLNKRIQEMEDVQHLGFLPSCGDESLPIGAAYEVAIRKKHQVFPLENLYLGLSYSQEDYDTFIVQHNLRQRFDVIEEQDIEERIAELLANREVVARFSGRCEWGARSLGNRAILANPSHLESFHTVNDLIKARDFWMPFAPTILDTAAPKYLQGYDARKVEAPFMITAFAATPLGIEHLRAAMHQGDFTIRPQVLKVQTNSEYYRLLKAFERRTGVGGVLNTSLNLHGYPLAATLGQALMTFEKSGLRHLALGPFLISKKEARRP